VNPIILFWAWGIGSDGFGDFRNSEIGSGHAKEFVINGLAKNRAVLRSLIDIFEARKGGLRKRSGAGSKIVNTNGSG